MDKVLQLTTKQQQQKETQKRRNFNDVIMTVDQFIGLDIPKRESFLNPWLKENSIILISGWRGVGKTFFALGILNAVSSGKSFGPWECEKAVPCLFLDGEMSTDDDRERIEQLNLNPELFIYSDHLANQWGFSRASLTNKKWRDYMKNVLVTKNIKLWVMDNISSLASGLDENAKRDWDPVNRWLLELRFAGISTIMLHHVNKDGGQRGTSAREDNLDISMMLKTPPNYVPEDGARFIVHFSKARVKTNDLKSIGNIEFHLIQQESGEHVWWWAGVKAENKRSIIKMIGEGYDQKTIVEELGITKGYVSRIKKDAIKDGHLTTKGKLTQSGFSQVSDAEI